MIDDILSGDAVKGYVARALDGQKLSSLLCISYQIDLPNRYLFLKAHFTRNPTDQETDEMLDVEGEVIADFPNDFKVNTEFELIYAGGRAHPLSMGFCHGILEHDATHP